MANIMLTTHSDLSLEYFRGFSDVFFYEDISGEETSLDEHYDILYCRDPFNNPEYAPDEGKIDKFLSLINYNKSIDNIRKFSDMRNAEDKYLQAQIFEGMTPETKLASEATFVEGEYLMKPRISQRAKNILFKKDEIEAVEMSDDWIVQELLDIKEELRVYVYGDEIFPICSIKSSKASGKVKVLGTRELTKEEISFVNEARKRVLGLDFVGFDIAVLAGGELKVIEANRSPQFKRYTEITGIVPFGE